MTNFIQDILPPELGEQILSNCDPVEVAAFAQTSRFFRSLIYETADQHFWRVLYLNQPFDDPRSCVSSLGKPQHTTIDWKSELQRIIRARTIVENRTLCRPDERCTVLRTLLDMIYNIPPAPHILGDKSSQNLRWVADVLGGCTLLDEQAPSAEEHQLRARLHTHYGITPLDIQNSKRVESRAFVYDLRKYTPANHFGPFMDGTGMVNWVHMQAIHHVISMHLVQLGDVEDLWFTDFPLSLPFCQPIIPEGMDLDEVEDWAGVGGMWTCAYCFCDHRELVVYNSVGRHKLSTLAFP
jgi:hypothetical protein